MAGRPRIDSAKRLREEIVACTRCDRLISHCREVAVQKRRAYMDWDYWGKPVAALGSIRSRLVVVGLAPGAHGANRTGRIFTGDSSGDFLYGALHRYGFASQPVSESRKDGLKLSDCYVTNVVRCAPPGNRPDASEHDACRDYFVRELRLLRQARVYLALGGVGYKELLRGLGAVALADPSSAPRFGHGITWRLPNGRVVLTSYHPSRQNTQTGRLTRAMFHRVVSRARKILDLPLDVRAGGRGVTPSSS